MAKQREKLGIQPHADGGLSGFQQYCHDEIAKIDAQPKPTEAEIEARERERQEYLRKCEVGRRRALWKRFEGEVGVEYAECRLNTFNAKPGPQASVLETLIRFCSKPQDRMDRGIGLFFFGPCGTGKDHLMIGAAHQFIGRLGVGVMWLQGSSLWRELRDIITTKDRTEADVEKRLLEPHILAISDPLPPGTSALGEHQAGMLFRVIDGRLRARKPTWMTVNVADRKQAETRMTAQIVDRLVGKSIVLECNWPSGRVSPRLEI